MKLFMNLSKKFFMNLSMKLFPAGKQIFTKSKRGSYLSALSLLVIFGSVNPVLAGGKDDPTLSMLMIDQLEQRKGDNNRSLVLDGQAWLGQDLQKLWLKFDVERVSGESEELELQALYSKAIAPLWDVQVGVRHDLKPTPSRTWAVIGLQGLAPYFFEVDAALFVDSSKRTAFRFQAEYEMLLTQRLILTPEFEFNLYAQNDRELGTGSGLSDFEAGLRLRYEVRREFAPYIGLSWSKKFANSADFARSGGEGTDDLQWVVGVRAWF